MVFLSPGMGRGEFSGGLDGLRSAFKLEGRPGRFELAFRSGGPCAFTAAMSMRDAPSELAL
jgi:hypothetical protein